MQKCSAVTRLRCWNVPFLTVRSFLIWPWHYLSTGCTGHTTLRPSARLVQNTLLQGKEHSGVEISPNRAQRQIPPHAVRSQRTCSRWPSVNTRGEEPHRSASIQTVRLEENQFLLSNSSAAFHAIDMVPRRGRKFTGHSFVGYHVDCTWGFAMTLKQSFCVSNI